MTSDATHLLRRLEPVVRPGQAMARSFTPQAPLESQRFDALLALAAAGSLSSGREVEAASTIDPVLDGMQIQRVTAAGDMAEAAGARTALVLVDGRSFIMDVITRRLTHELRGDAQPQVIDVDAAIDVGASGEGAARRTLRPPAAALPPAAVARQLAQALESSSAEGTPTRPSVPSSP